MHSERLRYHPVGPANLDAFHRLVQDEHVRRYMMDGNVFPREWSAERIRLSEALFERRGVGTLLVHDKGTDELVGFCGFEHSPGRPEPQLMYAMFERFAGRGFATEMARAAIAQARTQPGFAEIMADADEINVASVRVLEKLGFERIAVRPGAFGNLILFRLVAGRLPVDEIRANVFSRPAYYLIGTADSNQDRFLSMSPPSMLQGDNRYDRWEKFRRYVGLFPEWRALVVFREVLGVGHSSAQMFESHAARKAMFE
jgi:ribosomal-protein-alanine N-acetyltransferase